MRILLTSAGGILSRATAKCLKQAHANIYLVGVDADPTYLPLSPLDKRYLVPMTKSKSYIKAIKFICGREKIDIILPQSDAEILVLGKNRSRLGARIWLPKQSTIAICQDKWATQRLLWKLGIPVPETVTVGNLKDIAKVIAKHHQVWLRLRQGAGGAGAKQINSLIEAKQWLKLYPANSRFIAAEFLPGKIFGWNSVWQNGELLWSQTVERLRYFQTGPVALGFGTAYIVSVRSPEVRRVAAQTVLAVDKQASGCFAVDLRQNRQGVPCVTEINAGRLVTTSTIMFEKTKTYFPWYVVQLIDGKKPLLPYGEHDPIAPGTYLLGALHQEAKIFKAKQLKIRRWDE